MNEAPRIRPYPHDHPRPLWSVMIPVYNCSEYLTSTLQSVLMQDPGRQHMQIEVVDDASTDTDVEALVRGIAGDRVRYFRQPQNVGSLKNFEACINRASGQLLHILHGHDRVREGYYQAIGSLFERFPEAGAAFCRYDMVDQHGKVIWNHQPEQSTEGLLENWLLKIARRQRLQFCAVTVKRQVYESLGGFYGVSYGEDWEMWTRIAAHYPVAYTPAPLAEYRFHIRSISGRSFLRAENVRDIRWVIAAIG